MKTNDFALLLKIAGTYEGILNAPFSKQATVEEIQRAELWTHAACQFGLSASGNRADAVAMRRLVEAGYAEASGATQGRAHRLTVRGWFTAAAWLGYTPEGLRVLLNRVADHQSASKITLPGDKRQRLCMTWDLIPEAGQWMKKACRNAAVWKAYCDAAAIVEGHLCSLIALFWLTRYVSTSGRFWAVTITDAGRAVLNDWPLFKIPQDVPSADSDTVFEAWQQGYEKGKTLVRTSPPDAVKNLIARLLPASQWQ